MRLIEDHPVQPVRMYFEKLMQITFPSEMDLDEDENFDPSDKSFLEENNPSDAVFVTEFRDEISDGPSHSWQLETDFYVCKVPTDPSVSPLLPKRKLDLFILFTITWDDNLSRYTRQIHCAAECTSHDVAKSLLIKKYAIDNLNNSGDGGFRNFVEELLITKT